MAKGSGKSKKKNKVKEDIVEYDEDLSPERDSKKIIFGIWFLIIFGLLAAFLITTNQNTGEPPPDQPATASGQSPAQLDEALKPFQDQLAQDPKNVSAHIQIGFIYFDASRFAEAAQSLEKAIKLDERNVEALVGLGMSYQYASQPNKALEMFDKALSVKPDDDFAKVRKAYFLADVEGKYDEALTLMREVEAKLPDSENKSKLNEAILNIEKRATGK